MLAYLDMPSGLSGDMFLACLIDAGWPVDELRQTITRLKLPVEEWSIHAVPTMKGPLRATLMRIDAQEGHVHRGMKEISALIQAGDLPAEIKTKALGVFTRLGNAEAKVHGTTLDQIHFHEVGAVDALIDIVGVCAGLHALKIDKLFASAAVLGTGMTRSAHGPIPLPAPATLEILAAAGAPTRPAAAPGEWLTPTGAALLCELASFGQPALQLARIGTGAGQKDAPWPNIARLWLGESVSSASSCGSLIQLETNIDDMNPQLLPPVAEKLLAQGAKDVWFSPVHMKKGRPGTVLSVLTDHAHESTLAHTLLTETTTLGVRALSITHRHEADRTFATVATPHGPVRIKIKWVDGKAVGATPEFEDCRKLAEQTGQSLAAIQAAAQAAGQAWLASK